MRNKPMISVIMPVYNVEKYLDRAVVSVLNQTYRNIELILVNDCSSDRSGKKCDEWATRDSRVKVVHKVKNEGPGVARNTGIDLALGSYIAFVDSDDWIEPEMFDVMSRAAQNNNSQVTICGYFQDFLGIDECVKYTISVNPVALETYDAKQTAEAVAYLDECKVFAFVYNKLYSTKLIRENNIRFSKMMHSEDFFFNITIFQFVQKLKTLSSAYYHYNKPLHRTTLTSSVVEDYHEMINQRFNTVKQFLIKAHVYEGEAREALCNVHIKHLFSAFERDCWPESNMNFKQRYKVVQTIIAQDNSMEVLKNSKAHSHSACILNTIFKTRNALIIAIFAKLIWIGKNKLPRIFNKVK